MELRFQNVSFERDGVPILSDISFTTSGSPVFVVFGPSGAGKTTLLRLANRLCEATAGEVSVEGRPVRDYEPTALRRKVGMIFQEPRLCAGSVEDNVLLGARHHGLHVDAAHLLGQVGLPGYEKRNVRDLSGGERQRVSLARALAVSPSLLLLDEPTSSLDRRSALVIEDVLRRLIEKGLLSAVFVTHSHEQVQRLGATGIALDRGRVVHRGDLTTWLEHYDARTGKNHV